MHFESTPFEELRHLPVRLLATEEPWQTRLAMDAPGAGRVDVCWDSVAASASVVWMQDDDPMVALHRDLVNAVWVSSEGGEVRVTIESAGHEWKSRLGLVVGARVRIDDSLWQG
ncbi:hypothetical protein [Microbacterium sp.]|uniref:hypothetical protein n=1 Tax=Microbacterium sp. TaxID=51671 RepID=UPI00356676EC